MVGGASSPTCFFAELNRAFGPKDEFVDKPSTGLGAMANSTACLEALRWSAKVDRRDERTGETEADRERLCSLSAFPASAAEAMPKHAWHSGKGVLFAVTAHVADTHNERIAMLTLRSLRLFHPAADILVVDNASPSGSGSGGSSSRGGYDSHAFFSKLPEALTCAYPGCCNGGKGGVRLHGCRSSSASAFSSSPACECCGRVLVQRTHEAGAVSKAVGSLREFGALAQAALYLQYLPAADPHHIVLLQSSTGLKRPIAFADLHEAVCPFTFLHLPYSWHCCQTSSAADLRMRTARWGLSCSEAAFDRRGFPRSFMQSAPNSLWTASSHGAVVMTRGVLARLVGMGLFQLDVLDAMGNGRWCWETSAGLVGAWLAQQRRISASATAAATNASTFSAEGGSLDARCIQPIAYKLHGNNIEKMKDLNPKLQHHFKALAVRATAEAGKAVAETLPECENSSAHAAPWRLALHPTLDTMTRVSARCAEHDEHARHAAKASERGTERGTERGEAATGGRRLSQRAHHRVPPELEPRPWNFSLPDPPHPSCAPTAPTARFALGVYGGVSGAFALAQHPRDNGARVVDRAGRASCEGADYAVCLAAIESGHNDLREYLIGPSGGGVDTFIFSSTQSRRLQARLLELYDPVSARFDSHYEAVWQPGFASLAASRGSDQHGHHMLERHESRWSAMAHVLGMIIEAGAARGTEYARIYLTRPDIAIWRPVDLRRYCDDTFYLNNCFPPYWPGPCLADFHFVLTSQMARQLVRLPGQLGNATGRLILLTQQVGNASNAEFLKYVLRHVASRWAPDHIVVQRHEEIRRMADGKRAGSPLPFRTRYKRWLNESSLR